MVMAKRKPSVTASVLYLIFVGAYYYYFTVSNPELSNNLFWHLIGFFALVVGVKALINSLFDTRPKSKREKARPLTEFPEFQE